MRHAPRWCGRCERRQQHHTFVWGVMCRTCGAKTEYPTCIREFEKPEACGCQSKPPK